jgi:5-methylcytosine-specific restriction endonuclease McrA
VKKQSVASLKKRADAVFSKYIRLRDSENGFSECFTCGVQRPISSMQAGHFVSRRVNSLRFDELNVHSQCMGCNVMKHGDLYTYAKRLDETYGAGTADELHARRFETHSFSTEELSQIIERYKNDNL